MALPFDLPPVSAGFAALTPAARRLGMEAAAGAARALGQALGAELEVRCGACPGPAWERAPAARLTFDLAAVPGKAAALEVDPALVVRLVDRLAGGTGAGAGATALTPVERAALELLALVALEGACTPPAVEAALSPRLSRAVRDPGPGALAIDVELSAGEVRGHARLLLPPAALRALAGAEPAEGRLALPLSVRSGTAALSPAELEDLEPGDVVLLEPAGGAPDALVLPGGARASGSLGAEGFRIEEVDMPARTPQLPITLEVELCRIELPLGELARLEAGAVLPLPIDRSGRVVLRAGERAVARGQLVDLEGAVGVRIETVEVDP